MKKHGLGRGFESLIPTQLLDDEFDPTATQDEKLSELRDIPVASVMPNPHQPRRHFDDEALNELAVSIKTHGVMQPIVVTKTDSGFELVAGERRLRASQIVGLKEIPALVRSYNDQTKLELALIENLHREDLNPLEIATAYLKLNQQFNLTFKEIAEKAGGKSLSAISNHIRLLGLPKMAKQALIKGEISEGHARQILAIHEPDVQKELLGLIIKNGWSVRKAEQFVIGYKQGEKNKTTAVARVQTESEHTKLLGKKIKAAVSVKHMAKGGQLIIKFKNDQDLERITKILAD